MTPRVRTIGSLGLGTVACAVLLLAPAAALTEARSAEAPELAPQGRDGEFDCLIEPSRTIVVRSPVTGVIDQLYVARGSRVRAGEPLVKLDSKARRKSDLAASDFASAQDREDAESDVEVARADVLAAREAKQLASLEQAYALAELGLRLIRSPINGVVIDKAMNVGDLAQPADSSGYILKLAEIDLLRVKVIVPLAYYRRVKPGQRVDVMPERPLEGHYAATVSVVDKVIDAASGTFQVRIDLPNPKDALPGGLRCTVRMW